MDTSARYSFPAAAQKFDRELELACELLARFAPSRASSRDFPNPPLLVIDECSAFVAGQEAK